MKVAKLHGQLLWHSHADEDELFYVLEGHLKIELESGVVQVAPGELFIVPKGVRHNPIAEDPCLVMLLERKSTKHTGDALDARTRSIQEQLRPL
ncbi:cupin domain-containing protein [Mesoterricola sediminis]|uniref:cupin domain-containing protein n=1 Tax=Mesoterricola sediminis TaxID=2927980 RepID=UPI001FAED85E|nr:cupin domain-containing protein [Mesoterricola sediminis]